MSRSALQRTAKIKLQREESGEYADRVQHDAGPRRRGALRLDINGQYNFHNIMWQQIQSSFYFRGLWKAKTFSAIVDRIYNDCRHCEPFQADTRGGKTASASFCLVYKLFLMRLTEAELNVLLTHEDSPFIRLVGMLYVRIGLGAHAFWGFLAPLLSDDSEMKISSTGARYGEKEKTVKILELAECMLTSNKYYNTILPQLSVPNIRQHKAKIRTLRETRKRADLNRNRREEFRPGSIVQALYSEDFEWYDARIEEEIADGTFVVTYLPEDEYGNEETRSLGHLRIPEKVTGKKRAYDDVSSAFSSAEIGSGGDTREQGRPTGASAGKPETAYQRHLRLRREKKRKQQKQKRF